MPRFSETQRFRYVGMLQAGLHHAVDQRFGIYRMVYMATIHTCIRDR